MSPPTEEGGVHKSGHEEASRRSARTLVTALLAAGLGGRPNEKIFLVDCFRGMESGVCKVNDDFRRKKRDTGHKGKDDGVYLGIMSK